MYTLLIAVVTQGYNRYHRLLEALRYIKALADKVSSYNGFKKPDIVVISKEDIYLDQYSSIQVIHLPDSNIPRARNHALRIARSGGYDYLLFVDDDVLVNPDLVEQAVKCMRDNGRAGVVASALYIHYGKEKPPIQPYTIKPVCVQVDSTHMGATLLDINMIPEDIWFNEEKEVGEDTDFCHRLGERGIATLMVSGFYSIHWKLHHREYTLYYKSYTKK